MRDVEQWIGRKVTVVSHSKYKTVEDVWRGERYIVGPMGASCTRVLKREMCRKIERPNDVHVLGFTADERHRIIDIETRNPNMQFVWLLADVGITKEDCYHAVTTAGIELPAMYKLGYNHNNCIGCCKAGKGYWNKIRVDFPEIFAARAKVQREIGVGFRSGGELFFLDELDPSEGRGVPEPEIICGLFCSQAERLVDLAVRGTQIGGGE